MPDNLTPLISSRAGLPIDLAALTAMMVIGGVLVARKKPSGDAVADPAASAK